MVKLLFIATLILVPTALSAQGTDELDGKIRDFYSDVDGKEVSIKGAIGTFISDTLKFGDTSGIYDVIFDAGRNARKSIEGCEINLFSLQASNCFIEGKAEIVVDWNEGDPGDGYPIKLSIYEMVRTK